MGKLADIRAKMRRHRERLQTASTNTQNYGTAFSARDMTDAQADRYRQLQDAERDIQRQIRELGDESKKEIERREKAGEPVESEGEQAKKTRKRKDDDDQDDGKGGGKSGSKSGEKATKSRNPVSRGRKVVTKR